jgi:hypothetical protein
LKDLPYVPRVEIFRIKDATFRKGAPPKKNEKFCSTRNQGFCDKRKPVSKTRLARSNSCFNYENTTCHLPILTRVCTDFARAISAAKTSSSCSRNESGCPSAGKSGRGGAGACYKRAAWATCSTATSSAWTTRSCRTTCGARTTRSCRTTRGTRRAGYRYIKSRTSWRRESCCGGRSECRTTSCFARC